MATISQLAVSSLRRNRHCQDSDLARLEWMDAAGLSRGVPGNPHFNQAVFESVPRPVSEEEIRCAFTVEPISEESIAEAMAFAADLLLGEIASSQPRTPRSRP